MVKRIVNGLWVTLVVLAAVAGIGTHVAEAATLSFSPQSGTYFAGRSFSVSVLVSSPDQAMNAAQGEISFPTDQLEVLSISQANSVMNLWVQNPTFSNQDGTIDFGGVAIGDPAYYLVMEWEFFAGDSAAAFRRGLDLDDAAWARGRGWALCKALASLSEEEQEGDDDRIHHDPSGWRSPRQIIGRIIADHARSAAH